jgi:hypothetical protein
MIISFDDLYIDKQNGLDKLFYLKGNYPRLKVNIFVVPGRSNPDWLNCLKQDWIVFGMHGWDHKRGELIEKCMLDQWVEDNGNKLYKSPWYDEIPENLDTLNNNGFTLVTYPEKKNHPVKQVVLGKDDFRGHVWKPEDWERLEEVLKTNPNCELL